MANSADKLPFCIIFLTNQHKSSQNSSPRRTKCSQNRRTERNVKQNVKNIWHTDKKVELVVMYSVVVVGVGQRKKNVTGLTFVGKVGSLHFFSFTVKQFENTAIRLKSCLNNNPGKALFHS